MSLENNMTKNLAVVEFGKLKQSSGNGNCNRCGRTGLNSYTEYNDVKLCEICLKTLTDFVDRKITIINPSYFKYSDNEFNNYVPLVPVIINITMYNPIYVEDPNIIIQVDNKILTIIKKSIMVELKRMLEELEKFSNYTLRERYEFELQRIAKTIFLMDVFPPETISPKFLGELVKAFKPDCDEITMNKYKKYKAKYLAVTDKQ